MTFAFTTNDVVRAVKELDGEAVTPRVLGHWAAHGIALPSVEYPRTKGRRPRRYSAQDVARVRLIVRLRRAGLSLARVRVVLMGLAADLPELLGRRSSAVIRVDGWTVVIERPGQAARELPTGQLRLPLASVVLSDREARRFAA